MSNIKFPLVIGMQLLSVIVFCQTNIDELFIPTPNAYAIAKYGDVPVSNYTGIPNISIPIYEIKYRDLKVPIVLNYNASGIKIEEEASWIGLGWSLNAGGVITRFIKDKNDLNLVDGVHEIQLDYNGYPFEEQLNIDNVTFQNICLDKIDGEPDMFHFNFLGYSGKFILKRTQFESATFIEGILLEKSQPIKIYFNISSHDWTIITPDGIKYNFGTHELTETWNGASTNSFSDAESMLFYSSYDLSQVTSWYLDKIVSPLGSEINFEYDLIERDGKLYSPYGHASVKSYNKKIEIITDVLDYQGASVNTGCGTFYADLYTVSQSYNNNIYLKQISWPSGLIDFSTLDRVDLLALNEFEGLGPDHNELSPGIVTEAPQCLDLVKIFDNQQNRYILSYKFQYGYFNDNSYGSREEEVLYKRLKLVSLSENTGDGSLTGGKHSFKYFETASYSLPKKTSFDKDFWGYYNGPQSNESPIPYGTFIDTDYEENIIGDANRYPDPDEKYMKVGTLEEITYPTGGKTNFTFEPNDYYDFGKASYSYTDFLDRTENPDVIRSLVYMRPDGGVKVVDYLEITTPTEVSFEREIYYNGDGHPLYNDNYNENDCYALCIKINGDEDPDIDEPTSWGYNRPWPEVIDFNLIEYGLDNDSRVFRETSKIVLQPGKYKLMLKQFYDINTQEPTFALQTVFRVSHRVPQSYVLNPDDNGVYRKLAGGLRIAKIENEAATGKKEVIKFEYTTWSDEKNAFRSTGKLMMLPAHHTLWLKTADEVKVNWFGGAAACHGLFNFFNGTSWNNLPLGSSAQGNIVGYDKVRITYGEDSENGFTDKEYLNDCEKTILNFSVEGFPTNFATTNGLLLSERHFDAEGNPVKYVRNEYNLSENFILNCGYRHFKTLEDYFVQIGGIWTGSVTYNADCYLGVFGFTYNMPVYNHFLKESYDSIFDSKSHNSVITTHKKYGYNDDGLLTSKKLTNSSNSLLTEYRYPVDIPSKNPVSLTTGEVFGLKQLVLENRINTPIEVLQYSDDYLTGATLKTYSEKNVYVVPDKIYTVELPSPIYKSEFTKAFLDGITFIKDPRYTLKKVYDTYDADGNILQYHDADQFDVSFIWGYNNSYPIAKAENAQHDELYYTSYEEDEQFGTQLSQKYNNYKHTGNQCIKISVSSNGVPCDINTSALVSPKYTYGAWVKTSGTGVTLTIGSLGGGVNCWFSKDVPNTNNKWKYFELEIDMNAQGVDYGSEIRALIYNNGSTNAFVDDVRFQPSDARMTTYTYDPLIGITSITDANNKTITYKYDDFGRLEKIIDHNGNMVEQYKYHYKNE